MNKTITIREEYPGVSMPQAIALIMITSMYINAAIRKNIPNSMESRSGAVVELVMPSIARLTSDIKLHLDLPAWRSATSYSIAIFL